MKAESNVTSHTLQAYPSLHFQSLEWSQKQSTDLIAEKEGLEAQVQEARGEISSQQAALDKASTHQLSTLIAPS